MRITALQGGSSPVGKGESKTGPAGIVNVGTEREHFRLSDPFANPKNLLTVKPKLSKITSEFEYQCPCG